MRFASLRQKLAAAAKLPPYVVAQDRTLIELAEKRPATEAALHDILGLGASKIARYGAAFLDDDCAVQEASGSRQSPVGDASTRRLRRTCAGSMPKRSRPSGSLEVSTIYGHLAEAIEAGLISAADALKLDAAEHDEIEAAFERCETRDTVKLGPAFAALDGPLRLRHPEMPARRRQLSVIAWSCERERSAPALSECRAHVFKLRRPRRGVRGKKVCLRFQNDAVIEDLQAVGAKRLTRRRDIDDQLGGASGRRAFGRSRAFDDAVIAEAFGAEEAPRRDSCIWSRRAASGHAEPAEGHRDLLEICDGRDVDPAPRHGDDDIGKAEAELLNEANPRRRVGNVFADHILAGDAEVDAAGLQGFCDLAGRNVGDVDARKAVDLAAISARRVRPCAR